VEDGCVDLGEAAALVGGARHILVVSGSGISASAGLSTYVNGAGVYERAAKRYKLKRGIELFNWAFYAARPRDSQRFLAELADSARAAEPTRAHRGIVDLERRRFLARHVTLNVDGLSLAAGGSLWEGGDVGRTIELHGALRDVVDAETGAVRPLDDGALANFKARRDAFPTGVAKPAGGKKRPRGVDEGGDPSPPLRFRFRVLLYGDEEHGLVLDGPAALARLDADAAAADLVLWLGISFEQAASCEYLRRVEAAVRAADRNPPQLVVNPDDAADFNARSALAGADTLDLRGLRATADDLFGAIPAAAAAAAGATPPALPPAPAPDRSGA